MLRFLPLYSLIAWLSLDQDTFSPSVSSPPQSETLPVSHK